MNRRCILVATAWLALAANAGTRADDPRVAKAIPLDDRLKTGLKARRPEEFAFIEQVGALVRAGVLPAKLVDSAYSWALQRQHKYPFPLFERALRLQAGRIGVEL